MLKKVLFILFIVVICSDTLFAQRRDTLSVDSVTLVGAIAYHPNVDKLLFSGYRITGPYSFSAFLGIKNFKTGKVEVLPTYIVDIFPGYKFRSGEVYGWLTEEEEQKNSIEGPVLNLKIWDMDVTIPTRLNLQKLLIKISAQQ